MNGCLTLMKLTMNINYKGGGWSETYFGGPDQPLQQFAAVLPQLITLRRHTLPSSAEIVHAKMSVTGNDRDSVPVNNGVLPGFHIIDAENPGVVDTTGVGVLVRYTTAAGKWATRILRGIPDEIITDNKLLGSITSPAWADGAAVPDPTAQGTWYLKMGLFLEYLKRNTQWHSPARNRVVNANFVIDPWAMWHVRRVAQRDTGRPFGLSRGRRNPG